MSDNPPELTNPAERNETPALISSEKVEGTAVYDPAGNWLGAIQSVMIEKVSGKVAYAVLSFGGFLGLGKHFFPVPWSQLRYDRSKEGYVTTITESQLSGAPHYHPEQDWQDTDWRDNLDRYYGFDPDMTRTGGSI